CRQPLAAATASLASLPTVPMTTAPRCADHWLSSLPTPPAAACTTITHPDVTLCTWCSSTAAVRPLTISDAAAVAVTASGTFTASDAARQRICAYAPYCSVA